MTRIGFYAGSFDPPTFGHLDLVKRSLAVVDQLVVGVGTNADKRPWLPVQLRVQLLSEVLPAGVDVTTFDGLAVVAARDVGASLLVRGIRGPEDAAAEMQMALANRRLDEGIETILLTGSPTTAHIASRLVRELHRSGGDVGVFVPPVVAAALERLPAPGEPGAWSD